MADRKKFFAPPQKLTVFLGRNRATDLLPLVRAREEIADDCLRIRLEAANGLRK
jgi:hypothetical protein